MTLGVELKVDQATLKELENTLRHIPKGAPKALSRSINKGLTGGRTEMVKATREILNVKAKKVRDQIKIKKASVSRLSGIMTSKGQPLNLINFGARQTKKGVSVQVLKKNPRETIPHAWIGTGEHNNRLVFMRQRTPENAPYIFTKKVRPGVKYGALPDKYRLPMESKTGPRLQDIEGRDEVMGRVQDEASSRLMNEMNRQIDLLLG